MFHDISPPLDLREFVLHLNARPLQENLKPFTGLSPAFKMCRNGLVTGSGEIPGAASSNGFSMTPVFWTAVTPRCRAPVDLPKRNAK